MDEFSPSTQGWIIAFGSAAILWVIAKVKLSTPALAYHLSRWLVTKELRKAKRARVNAFAIQREISKEAALFICFVLSFLITIGFFLTVSGNTTLSTKMIMVTLLMTPTLAIEIWWLAHRDYVDVLIKQAAKLGPNFREAVPMRPEPERRTLNREVRRKRLNSQRIDYKRVVSRR